MGSSATFKLPPDWFSYNFVGFALSAIVAFWDHYDDGWGFEVFCECKLKTEDGLSYFALGPDWLVWWLSWPSLYWIWSPFLGLRFQYVFRWLWWILLQWWSFYPILSRGSYTCTVLWGDKMWDSFIVCPRFWRFNRRFSLEFQLWWGRAAAIAAAATTQEIEILCKSPSPVVPVVKGVLL